MSENNRSDYEKEKEARERRLRAYAEEIQKQILDSSSEIVHQLVEERHNQGLTQSDMAELTGMIDVYKRQQLYLVNGYFLGVSRIVLVQLLGCSSPVLIVVGNLVFDLFGALGVIKYLMMKIPVVRFLCGET